MTYVFRRLRLDFFPRNVYEKNLVWLNKQNRCWERKVKSIRRRGHDFATRIVKEGSGTFGRFRRATAVDTWRNLTIGVLFFLPSFVWAFSKASVAWISFENSFSCSLKCSGGHIFACVFVFVLACFIDKGGFGKGTYLPLFWLELGLEKEKKNYLSTFSLDSWLNIIWWSDFCQIAISFAIGNGLYPLRGVFFSFQVC